MSLPPSIQSKLTGFYDQVPAAVFLSSMEARNFETELASAGLSYRTRITRHKRTGRQFVVLVLSPA